MKIILLRVWNHDSAGKSEIIFLHRLVCLEVCIDIPVEVQQVNGFTFKHREYSPQHIMQSFQHKLLTHNCKVQVWFYCKTSNCKHIICEHTYVFLFYTWFSSSDFKRSTIKLFVLQTFQLKKGQLHLQLPHFSQAIKRKLAASNFDGRSIISVV